MKRMKLVVSVVLVGMCSSCFLTGSKNIPVDPPKPPPASDTSQQKAATQTAAEATATVDSKSKEITKSTGTIETATTAIKTETAVIATKVPEPTKTDIKPNLDTIDKNASAISTESKKLDEISAALAKTSGQLLELQNAMKNMSDKYNEQSQHIADLNSVIAKKDKDITEITTAKDSEITALKSDYNKTLQKYLAGLIILGVVIVAGCIALGLTGNPKAFGGAFAGGALICIAMVVMSMTKYGWLFGLVGGCGFAVMMISLAWYVWDYMQIKRHELEKQTALEEAVETVEVVKSKLDESTKKEMFKTAGMVDRLQSAATKEIVSKIKQNL